MKERNSSNSSSCSASSSSWRSPASSTQKLSYDCACSSTLRRHRFRLSLFVLVSLFLSLCHSLTHEHTVHDVRPLQSCVPFDPLELQALGDIFDSTAGWQWTWTSTPWNFSQPEPDPCSQKWQGITCNGLCSISTLSLVGSVVPLGMKGTLPSTIDRLTNLLLFQITSNPDLRGSIPSSLGSLSSLISISLSNNALSGTLPVAIGNLKNLQSISVDRNHLRGNISHIAWSSMDALNSVVINRNFFSGTVPLSLFQASNLQTIDAGMNNFAGPLPSTEISSFSLRTIDFSMNYLNGTLPSYTGMKSIANLRFFSNELTGSIPVQWTKFSTLLNVEIDSNLLTGTIPPGFIDMPNLGVFYVFKNYLHGSLPAFSSRHPCSFVNVYNNLLSGSIPANLSLNYRMYYLDLHANLFSGEFPKGIASADFMYRLYVHNNALSGPLPSLYKMKDLWQARFDWNFFTGSIPQGTDGLHSIRSLNFSYNLFTGTIATTAFSNVKSLAVLDLSANYFSGTLGSSLSYTPELQRLLLQDNLFSGDIYGLLDFSTQRNMSTLDISANEFSGSIPPSLFSSNLSVFVASRNCFTGSLSMGMCANDQLEILALDGLHTATFCKVLIFPDIPKFDKTYILTKPLLGSVPACLFNMSSLRTLHLSGNAIHGSLPSDLRMGEELKYLSLSHNQLTGTIPSQLLRHLFLSLDLSFNKLTGAIDAEDVHNFSVSSETVSFDSYSSSAYSLSLDLNRLSGDLPSSWRDIKHLSILQGNMFACPEGKEKLPQQDDNLAAYECGSNVVNTSLYAWMGGVFFLFLLFFAMSLTVISPRFRGWNGVNGWLFSLWRYIEVEVYGWWGVFSGQASATFYQQPIEYIYEFGVVMREIRRWIFALSAVIVFVFLPMFLVLSAFFGTYAHEYAWSLALAYLSGTTPAVIVMVSMELLLFGIFSGLCKGLWINIFHLYQRCLNKTESLQKNNTITNDTRQDESDNTNEERALSTAKNPSGLAPVLAIPMQTLSSAKKAEFTRSFARCYTAMALGGLLNVAIVLSVNMSYVSTTFSAETQQFVSFLLCVYKIVWNRTVMEVFQFILMKLRPRDKNNRNGEGEIAVVSFMLWMSLFNNIIAPCIAVAFVSGDCFYYAFSAAPTVSTSFQFEQCDAYFLSFSSSTTGVLRCQEFYSTGYISAYDPPFTYNYQCTSSLLTKFVDVIIYRFALTGFAIPLVHVCVKWLQERVFIYHGTKGMLFHGTTLFLPNILRAISDVSLKERQSVKQAKESEQRKKDVLPRASFKVKNFMVGLISDIAVLLTFGTIFPPVAIIGCSALFTQTIFTQLILGRAVVLSRTQPWLVPAVEKINAKCGGIRYLLIKSLLSLTLLSSIFWSLFLFDILGDEVGWERSLWVVSLMTAVPGMIIFTNYLLQLYDPQSAPSIEEWRDECPNESEKEVSEDDIELAGRADGGSARDTVKESLGSTCDNGCDSNENDSEVQNDEEVHNVLHDAAQK